MSRYATVAELRADLGIEESDTSRDPALASALAAAEAGIEAATGRRFWLDQAPEARVYSTFGRLVVGDGIERMLVDDIGDQAVTVATGQSSGPWEDLDVELWPLSALSRGRPVTSLAGRWPAATRIRVTARWGWPSVPADIAQATRIQAARLYRRKDSPEGVTGSAEWGVVRLSRRDPDVWTLIEPYMVPGFG
ncbi:phage gp6-like head-tail connector protein [Streptomyces carpaticus]|uniref:phage gp6-like head-tail connector protein n=1 Tax=Streptomyces carpaticus TaxID=285558 RepID=UPI0031F7E09C